MALYNLYAVVDFPTRITINSSTAIDNFFVDMEKTPVHNGLSDHDDQFLVLHDVVHCNTVPQFTTIRQIDKYSIQQFQYNLTYENWSDTFNEEDIDTSFKSFINSYLRIFNSNFPYVI